MFSRNKRSIEWHNDEEGAEPATKRFKEAQDAPEPLSVKRQNFSLLIDLLEAYPHCKAFSKDSIYSLKTETGMRKVQLEQNIQYQLLNPCSLTENEQEILSSVIDKYLFEHKLAPGKQNYIVESKEADTFIYCELTHWLGERGSKPTFFRRKKTHTEGQRFEIYTINWIGKRSSSANIIPSHGTLIRIQEKNFLFKATSPKRARIIKNYNEYIDSEMIENEYKLTHIVQHFHAKPPLGNQLVMQYISEMDLSDIILADKKGEKQLTVKERFLYSIALAEALEQQIHAHGIIHLDLKTDNIRVSKQSNEIILHIIDLGLAKRTEPGLFVQNVGAKRYMSPEVYYGDYIDERSDVYALARIISELFGFDIDLIQTEAYLIEEFNDGMSFTGLFAKIPELDESFQEKILDLLKKMSHIDVSHRYTALQAKTGFLTTYQEFEKAQNTPKCTY